MLEELFPIIRWAAFVIGLIVAKWFWPDFTPDMLAGAIVGYGCCLLIEAICS